MKDNERWTNPKEYFKKRYELIHEILREFPAMIFTDAHNGRPIFDLERTFIDAMKYYDNTANVMDQKDINFVDKLLEDGPSAENVRKLLDYKKVSVKDILDEE